MKVGPVVILVLITSIAHSQAHRQPGSAAQGSLTVTANVESSVWLVALDGKRDLVVANAPDPKESFSHSRPHKSKRSAPAAVQTAVKKEVVRQDGAAVQFSFPMAPRQFEVTRKTVMMDVTENGRTEQHPVTVTTVVPQ